MNRYILYASEEYALAIMRPLQKAIRQRGDDAVWFFDGPGEHLLHPEEKRLTSLDEARRYHATAVFVPGNEVPSFIPGVKVQIFHGFNAGKPRHIHIRGFFDIYCTTGPKDTRAFEQEAQRRKYFKVYETGWPKLDPLYTDKAAAKAHKKPVILYHSTFSPRWSAAEKLFPTLQKLTQDDRWQWLISFHPKMSAATVAKYKTLESSHVRYCEEDNILNIQAQADVMISDTSSALHEFLVQNKPVITFENRNPGPYLLDINNPEKLASTIEYALSHPEGLMETIRDYADLIHPYKDGQSSRRVLEAVDAFVAQGHLGLMKKPLNLWRKIRLRKRLGYYKL